MAFSTAQYRSSIPAPAGIGLRAPHYQDILAMLPNIGWVELFFPVLLVLGLAGRFAAVVLFLFNIIAVLSYPGLMAAGIEQHQIWGLMLLVTLSHGSGKLSLDHWIGKRFFT